MACTATPEDVEELVLGVVRETHPDFEARKGRAIAPEDSFEGDIGLADAEARHVYFGPIHTRLAERGCRLTISAFDFEPADTVEDLAGIVEEGIDRDEDGAEREAAVAEVGVATSAVAPRPGDGRGRAGNRSGTAKTTGTKPAGGAKRTAAPAKRPKPLPANAAPKRSTAKTAAAKRRGTGGATKMATPKGPKKAAKGPSAVNRANGPKAAKGPKAAANGKPTAGKRVGRPGKRK